MVITRSMSKRVTRSMTKSNKVSICSWSLKEKASLKTKKKQPKLGKASVTIKITKKTSPSSRVNTKTDFTYGMSSMAWNLRGTSHTPYARTATLQDYPMKHQIMMNFESICFLTAYKTKSTEELRREDCSPSTEVPVSSYSDVVIKPPTPLVNDLQLLPEAVRSHFPVQKYDTSKDALPWTSYLNPFIVVPPLCGLLDCD
ncbi:hypothetical protein Ae201684P_021295 [Aphanomyces euteiches]|nr:hypothetical protein Ae201684P_021295 [Aphanomyces euteiches]KAH9150873.1 hypothetical protein AeRB84_006378 [Aphanomyces euteiches]